MKYELTKDLETGNVLIDSEHRELFRMINALQDACSQGKGRERIADSSKFLVDYVHKHFGDEERLQKKTNYPGYAVHHQFHDGYKKQLAAAAQELLTSEVSIASLAKLNQMIGTLISHIKIEDKKLAAYVKEVES